jgi:hypothetical protein
MSEGRSTGGGRLGDPIVVRAQHDFQVTGVAVALTASRASGNAIESGAGTQAVRCAPA